MGAALVGPASAGIPLFAEDDVYEVEEDTELNDPAKSVLDNDAPSPTRCVTPAETTSLAGDLQLATDGTFVFTPDENFNGVTSFTYNYHADGGPECGGEGGTTATVTITVNPINDAPTAVADSFIALAGRTLNVGAPGVLSNDSDVDGDSLSATKMTNPAHGIVTLAADGAFSYTPQQGYVGPDAFSYRATDGAANSPTRVVTLNVTAIPPSPTPAPTPSPTPAPTPTPEASVEPSPSESAEASGSLEPSVAPSDSAVPSASLEPGASPDPGETGDGGGLSIPVIVVLLLLLSLLAFGAAVYVPKLLKREPAGGPIDDGYDGYDDDPDGFDDDPRGGPRGGGRVA